MDFAQGLEVVAILAGNLTAVSSTAGCDLHVQHSRDTLLRFAAPSPAG
jgi:hypothetical protein